MSFINLNGTQVEAMMINALNNLRLNEEHINSINVFPVPDGDTGSNMRLTLENGIKYAKSTDNAGDYLKELARGMLYGARGNSGVILSQIFAGFADELKRDSIIDSVELYEGFESGYKRAYESVSNPKEGTILTVSREGLISVDKNALSRREGVEIFFGLYLANLKKSLEHTPELLPSLKEAGVIDSGGLGYVKIIEGFVKYLNGDVLETDVDVKEECKHTVFYPYSIDIVFNTNATGKKPFNKYEAFDELNEKGGEVVYTEYGSKYSINMLTYKPENIFRFLNNYGKIEEFNIKENIPDQKHLSVCKIGIVNGIEIREIYMGLGCNIVIDGGKTMNTSTEEILDAINSIDADKYIIIPNNKNIFPAVYQAKKMLENSNIDVIESTNILEGYYALSLDDETKEYSYRVSEMKSGISYIKSFEVFKATRNAKQSSVEIRKDYYTSSSKGEILASCENITDTIIQSLSKIELGEYSQIILLKGQNFNCDEDELSDLITSKFDLEPVFVEGGQQIHEVIVGLI